MLCVANLHDSCGAALSPDFKTELCWEQAEEREDFELDSHVGRDAKILGGLAKQVRGEDTKLKPRKRRASQDEAVEKINRVEGSKSPPGGGYPL